MMFGKLQMPWIYWLLSVRAFFVQSFQGACWYGGGLMVDFETLWPQDATKVAATAVLGFFFAFLTIFLTVRGDNINLHPLPGKFATVPDVWNFLIVALTVLSGMFNRLSIFLYPLSDLCMSTTTCLFWFDSSKWWWMTKGFYMCVTSFLYSTKTGSDGRPRYSSKRLSTDLNR